MKKPQIFIRHSKSCKLAHLLAKKENRTVAQVVERALELYAHHEPQREPAPDFFSRIAREYGTELDLDVLIREGGKPNSGVDL